MAWARTRARSGPGAPGGGAASRRDRSDAPQSTARPSPELGTRLEPRERALGYGGAVLAAVLFLALWAPHLGTAAPKGQPAPSVDLAFGLGLAAMLALATASGRRYVLGFASLVLELGPWGKQPLLALPFVAFGAWLVVRASRDARRRAEARRQAGREARPGEQAHAQAGQRPGRTPGAKDRRGRALEAEARPRPAPSKRYTPPKVRTRRMRRRAADDAEGRGTGR